MREGASAGAPSACRVLFRGVRDEAGMRRSVTRWATSGQQDDARYRVMTRDIEQSERRVRAGHTRYRQTTRSDANDARPMFLY
jgi:hypothetical protein